MISKKERKKRKRKKKKTANRTNALPPMSNTERGGKKNLPTQSSSRTLILRFGFDLGFGFHFDFSFSFNPSSSLGLSLSLGVSAVVSCGLGGQLGNHTRKVDGHGRNVVAVCMLERTQSRVEKKFALRTRVVRVVVAIVTIVVVVVVVGAVEERNRDLVRQRDAR